MNRKPSGKYPRYVSIYDDLLSEIQTGKYRPGDKLPGENELSEKYSVSRNTLRQALLLLSEDGILSNHQGKGTFVLRNSVSNGRSIAQLNDPLETLSTTPVDRIETTLEIRRISPKHQEIFHQDASKLLVLLEIVYFSQESRIGCALVFIPYDVLAADHIPLDDMDKVRAFYRSYVETEGFVADGVLRIAYARDPVTQLLAVPHKHMMMMLDEVIHAPAGEVVMTQKLFFLPDYYEFALTRKNDRIAAK